MKLLENKSTIVTGGGQGIGRAIAETFSREGARVLIADLDSDKGEETVHSILSNGGKAIFFKGDVSEEPAVKEMVSRAIEYGGGLDIACNNAAVSRYTGHLDAFTLEQVDETLAKCLTNTWLCMKYEAKAMEAEGGSIINISSNASLKGQAFNSIYSAAKSGVNALTKSATSEYGSKGIRVNAICPGVVRTPGLEKYFTDNPSMEAKLKKGIVLKRLGEANEIAEVVTFLVSDRASFLNGQIISVDGGAVN